MAINQIAALTSVPAVKAATLTTAGNALTTTVPATTVAGDVKTTVPGGTTSTVQLEDAKGLTFRSWGDPHEVSGDGLKFDNMGIGYYTALKSASGDLMVVKRQESIPNTGADGSTVNTEAAVKAGDDVVKYNTKNNKLHINDQEVTLKDGETRALPGGGSVTKKGNKITVTSPKGDEITFVDQGKYMDLEGKLSPSRKDGEVTGSLGRFDKDTDASNDLVLRDGTQAKTQAEFIDNWKTNDAENLLTKPAAEFRSPEAKEIAALKKENEALYAQEQKLSDERRPLLAEIAKNEPIYKALKELPDDMLSESDKAFMKKFEDTKAKVEDLSAKIKDLNAKQAENQKKIDALTEIIKLKGENALLYQTEQDKSNERRPLLSQQAEMKDRAEALKALQAEDPNKLSEADLAFLGRYQQILDKINKLNEEIRKLNEQQKANEERIRELDRIAHPDKPVPLAAAPIAGGAIKTAA
ncbi:MAG: VWD domain-containing protein [Candidatus Sericytochromatia bacterium]|nr:VWD domain-containing protein [Candidatus Tanganyikabacteria bacterium]